MTRPPPSARSDYRVFRTIPTRWSDNDIFGHMNNVVHYSLFDTAINGWLIDEGALDIGDRGGQVGYVVETACRYFREMAFPDAVTAGIRVKAVGSSSVSYEIGLFRNDEDTAAAEGRFVHVYVDRSTKTPSPIGGQLRAVVEAALMPPR